MAQGRNPPVLKLAKLRGHLWRNHPGRRRGQGRRAGLCHPWGCRRDRQRQEMKHQEDAWGVTGPWWGPRTHAFSILLLDCIELILDLTSKVRQLGVGVDLWGSQGWGADLLSTDRAGGLCLVTPAPTGPPLLMQTGSAAPSPQAFPTHPSPLPLIDIPGTVRFFIPASFVLF